MSTINSNCCNEPSNGAKIEWMTGHNAWKGWCPKCQKPCFFSVPKPHLEQPLESKKQVCPGCESLLVLGNGSLKCPKCLSHLPIQPTSNSLAYIECEHCAGSGTFKYGRPDHCECPSCKGTGMRLSQGKWTSTVPADVRAIFKADGATSPKWIHGEPREAYLRKISELEKQLALAQSRASENESALEDALALVKAIREDFEEAKSRAESAEKVAEAVKRLLSEHHQWHLNLGVQDESCNGLNMSAEYADSDFFNRTDEALHASSKGSK